MIRDIQRKNLIIDSTALFLIGFFSMCYTVFLSSFAELHISIPQLNFPIFIGEILLFICFILLCIKWRNNPIKAGIPHYLIAAYFLYVLVKAFYGSYAWGPLAYRHAALFYYPIFAIFGYTFYNRAFFNNKKLLVLSLLLILGASDFFGPRCAYSYLAYFILAIMVIRLSLPKGVQYVLILLLLLVTSYKHFFATSRTGLLSNIAVIIFVITTLLFISNIKRIYKISLFLFTAIIVLVCALKLCNPNNIRSLIDMKATIESYNKFCAIIMSKKDNFRMKEYEPQLYHPEVKTSWKKDIKNVFIKVEEDKDRMVHPAQDKFVTSQEIVNMARKALRHAGILIRDQKIHVNRDDNIWTVSFSSREVYKPANAVVILKETNIPGNEIVIEDIITKLAVAKAEPRKVQSSKEAPERKAVESKSLVKKTDTKLTIRDIELGAKFSNTTFRIFIWSDMLRQFLEEKPFFFGFDFGKPLRSKKVEMAQIAEGDWRVDWGGTGWITAHNSYLHIIYRSSIIGVLYILTIFIIMFRMIKKSVKIKLVNGILLCGVLIHWLVTANFLVILELPYNAIPFWSLFGMTFAYLKSLEVK